MVGTLPESVPESANMINWIWIISITAPAIAGLGGVWIGALLTSRQQKEQRKLAFIEKQLRYFYSPLLGIRNEVRMLNELQVKISKSADANWQKICKETHQADDFDFIDKEMGKRREQFKRIIDYNNKQLTESLLPSYSRMVSIFREYYYLAVPSTCKYFCPLLEYVDIWDRWLANSIPNEVIEDLDHGERVLHPFYDEIEKTHDKFRKKLANGKT